MYMNFSLQFYNTGIFLLFLVENVVLVWKKYYLCCEEATFAAQTVLTSF